MLSLKQLTYAVAVADTLHFKQAAARCNVSQSALSTGLAELEQRLGVLLFERDNKKVLLTSAGEQVIERARRVVLEASELESLGLGGSGAPLSAPLSLGMIPTIAPFLLPNLLNQLNQNYPKAQLNYQEHQSAELVDLVRRGELDLGILALPYPCEGLLSFEFFGEDFYWVAPKDHELAGLVEITSDELHNAELLLLTEGHCLKEHALAVCHLPAPPPKHAMGAASLTTLIQLVRGNLGTTLVPQIALNLLVSQDDQLQAVRLTEPGPHRNLAIIMRPTFSRSACMEALRGLCRQACLNSIAQVEMRKTARGRR